MKTVASWGKTKGMFVASHDDGWPYWIKNFVKVENEKFEVGDRVRAVRQSDVSERWKIGDTGTVKRHGGTWVTVAVDDTEGYDPVEQIIDEKDMELIEDEAGLDPMLWGPHVSDMEEVPAAQQQDNVYQPNHYARYVIEPITFINANKLPFNIGNVIKYALRYDAKDGVQDLRKAIRYLQIQIECLERDKRVDDGQDSSEVWKDKL